MIWGAFLIVVFYFCAIVALYIGYHKVLYFSNVRETAKIKFSVIVPFRNEAKNLSRLLKTLEQLQYPTSHFEVIFVNDASSDTSEEVILQQLKESKLTFQILQNTLNQPSPKKTAITKAISIAKYPWIVTTDADCSVHENWLEILSEFIQTTNPNCVAMPVAYEVSNSFLHRYQQLDNWSLQAVTVGSFGLGNIVLSNGANFAYTKEAFNLVHGFEGNLHIASGDDMFLLEKFKRKTPKKIGYLKSRNAVVTTQPVDTWKELIAQRLRWASKTTKQKSVASKLLGLLIVAMNGLVLTLPIVAIFWPTLSIFLVTIFISKICIDFWLLQKSSQFFKKPFPFLNFLGSTLLYPIVTIIVILTSFSGTYLWKERSFKKQPK